MKRDSVGKSIAMHDAVLKASGELKYVVDFNLPDMLHGYVLTSKVAHANFKKIDISNALKVEGVKAIYTHENINKVLFNSYMWIEGLDPIKDEMILNDKVRFFGDRIALVIATSRKIAQKAAELIEIEYEKLPVAHNLEKVKEINPEISSFDNCFVTGTFECGDGNRDFDDAIIVTSEATSQKTQHCAMEVHASVAEYDGSNGLIVYSPCQVAWGVQTIVADVCSLPESKVRVIKTTTGGSFGGKTHPITELLAAYAANDLKANVSVVYSREQVMTSARTRTATSGQVSTYFDRNGKILARDIDMDFDAGGYVTNTETVCTAAGKKSFRLYALENQRYTYKAYLTNSAISGAFRGYGSPQIHFYTETNMDLGAKALNLDPVELRLRNLALAYMDDPTGGPNLGNLSIVEAVKKGAEEFDWYRKKSSPKSEGRFVKGYGMAVAAHGNGYYPAYPDFIDLELELLKSGEFKVNASVHDQGCGTVVTLSQIVAQELNTDFENIIMKEADTGKTPFDSAGTQACRVTAVIGKGMQLLAKKFKDEFYKKVAELYHADIDDVAIIGSELLIGDEKYSLADICTELLFKVQYVPKVELTYQSISNPVSSAVNFIEVEVDRLTGNVKVEEVVSVHDIGKQINPIFCRGQIHGGIQNALGFALSEEYIYNDEGIQTNTNFSRYNLFNAMQMPKIETFFIENEEEHGPFGAKSLGEISTIACAPAIVNAIYDAVGIMFTHLPVTPQKIQKGLKEI